MSQRLTKEVKSSIFKTLATKSLLETGLEYGFDKKYKDKTAIQNAVYYIYKEVRGKNLEYGISDEVKQLVKDSIESRKLSTNKQEIILPKPEFAKLDVTDIKNITINGRNKAMRLLHAKMDDLEAHPRKLAKENIVSIAKVAGILFDKAQIVQGEATEHVALLSKVSDDMKPEDAISALLKMREGMLADKYEEKV